MTEGVQTAVIAAASALLGSVVGVLSQIAMLRYQESRQKAKDAARRSMLKTMLDDDRFEWRNLTTLSHVIGADLETTKRLLVDIDARASENGKDVWGLLSRHPLNQTSE